MSEPLTLEHFQKFEKTIDRRFDVVEQHFDDTMRSIAETLTEHGGRFDRIDATLADHTARLGRLERHLDVSDRLDKIEVVLAEQFGRDILARAGL